jgi:Protein of unknown function (DUF2000)
MPVNGHQTNDYEEFKAMVSGLSSPDYLGPALYGPERAVKRLTGSFALLR